MTKPSPRKRPFGVTVIITVQLISIVILGLDFFVFQTDYTLPFIFPGLSQSLPLSGSLMAVLIFELVLIVGLWRLKRWAWFLLMIQLGASMVASLWAYLHNTNPYVYMLLNVIMVFYLNQRDVQRAFERRSKPAEAQPWTT
jgi:hypothetical protein